MNIGLKLSLQTIEILADLLNRLGVQQTLFLQNNSLPSIVVHRISPPLSNPSITQKTPEGVLYIMLSQWESRVPFGSLGNSCLLQNSTQNLVHLNGDSRVQEKKFLAHNAILHE